MHAKIINQFIPKKDIAKADKLLDPWHRLEAWRNLPEHSMRSNLRYIFPGIVWGTGAFLILVLFEELYWIPRHPQKKATTKH